MKKIYPAVILALLCIGFYGLYLCTQPRLVINAGGEVHTLLPVRVGDDFNLRFIHSVHRTPVIEKFKINAVDDLVLYSAEYESYGVGMPFLPDEGVFRQQGDKFVLDGLDRHFEAIRVRTGPEAKVSLLYQGKTYSIYEYFPSGTLIEIRIEPYYFRWIRQFTNR